MVSTPIRIGLVGANAHTGWTRESHIPALKALAGFELTAVATGAVETAREAAAAFGAKAGYGHFGELVQSEDVDVVVVCVRTPAHLEVVEAAVAARKHVICEWPLGRNTDEATRMAEAAGRAGVRTAIGLQGRMSPAVRSAAGLVKSGAIGRPLAASIYGPVSAFGPRMPSSQSWCMEPANGTTLASVAGGHTLDMAISVLGGIDQLAVLPTIMFKDIQLDDPDGTATRCTADHLLIHARLVNGCALNVEIAGSHSPDSEFRFRIVGTEGELVIGGNHPAGPQASDLTLNGSVPFERPVRKAAPGLEGSAINVAELYAGFAQDLAGGTNMTPDFDHAVRIHRLIDLVDRAGATGGRQTPRR